MSERTLRGCRILVVEDEYMLADDLRSELSEAGATVIGPIGTLPAALELIRAEPDIDGAVLDLNLRGEMAFPVADALAKRGVPIVFATGYDQSTIPTRLEHIVRCEKPVAIAQITRAIGRAIEA